jgi:hypothetical protein
MDVLEILFFGAGALAGGALLVFAVTKWPAVGFLLIGIVAVLAWDIPAWPAFFSIAGLSITFPDIVVAALLIAAGLTRSSRQQASSRLLTVLSVLFVCLLAFSLLRGMAGLGVATSLNEARTWIYIVVTTLWMIRVGPWRAGKSPNLDLWVIGLSVMIGLVALMHIGQYGLGSASSSSVSSNGERISAGRPIVSGQALVVAVGSLCALARFHLTRQLRWLILAAAFAGIVLLAQHRSVWLALMVAILIFVSLVRRGRIGWILSGVAAVLSVFVFFQSVSLGKLGVSLSESATDTTTYEGRVYDWAHSISSLWEAGTFEVLVGMPLGSGWDRLREDGLLISYIPHSWYVGALLRVGIIGLVVGVTILLIGVRLGRAKAAESLVLLPILCALMIYCWAYNLQWYLAPLLAWSIWGGSAMAVRPRTLVVRRSRHYRDSHVRRGVASRSDVRSSR